MENASGEPQPNQRSERAAKLGRLAGLHAKAAARSAQSFVGDHESEIRTAGLVAAQFAVSRVGHPILRPIVQAAAAEFARSAQSPAHGNPPTGDAANTSDTPPATGDQRPA